jgi:hypothetical protein
MVGHPTMAVWGRVGQVAVPCPHEDGQKVPGMMGPAASTRKQEESQVITNPIIVEQRCARCQLKL